MAVSPTKTCWLGTSSLTVPYRDVCAGSETKMVVVQLVSQLGKGARAHFYEHNIPLSMGSDSY